MSWNYRIMRHKNEVPDEMKEYADPYWFGIHEVYTDHGKGTKSWTDGHIQPAAESPAQLRKDMELMMQAFDRPVLDYDTGEEIGDDE